MEAPPLKSPIKDTQVYFTSLIVPPSSHRRPERAHIWRILLSRVFQACQLLTAATMKTNTNGCRVKRVFPGLYLHSIFLQKAEWMLAEWMVSPPRWLLAPFIAGLINNLWKCSIIVMAFRQPGCDTAAALAIYLFKNEYVKEQGFH